jgi:hypothetical protein
MFSSEALDRAVRPHKSRAPELVAVNLNLLRATMLESIRTDLRAVGQDESVESLAIARHLEWRRAAARAIPLRPVRPPPAMKW